MNQLKTILVGVDFSECSRRALEQAVRLARWNNAQFSLLHVQDSSELELAGVEFPPPLDELRRRHRERAIAQLAEWAEQAGAPAQTGREVINGAPLDVLLQESRNRRADLLVLGTTGESLRPHGTGTLVTKCLRKASAKVMLVHPSQGRPYRRVLACVDFSETSRVAVAQALHVADNRDFIQARCQADESCDEVLEKYRGKIVEQFFPKRGEGKLKLGEARKAIRDYRKATGNLPGTAELLMTYVENGTRFAHEYGDIAERFYTSVESALDELAALLRGEARELYPRFSGRLARVEQMSEGIGWGFHDFVAGLVGELEDELGEQ